MQKKVSKRKLLIVAPVFILLFAGILYWIVGNGKKTTSNQSQQQQKASAFNVKLPAANLKETGKNKLEIYMQAQRDSAQKKEWIEKDPYEKNFYDPAPPLEIQQERLEKTRLAVTSRSSDPNEKKINDRLEKLYKQLNQPAEETEESNKIPVQNITPAISNSEIHQLERLMLAMQSDTSSDPELGRIETMLEKLLDVQHPERVKERLLQNQQTKKRQVFNVTVGGPDETENNAPDFLNAFYSLAQPERAVVESNNTIQAVVHENQTVQDNSTVKIRLLQDVYVNSSKIPKDNFVFGQCKIINERVHIQIKDITWNSNIYPIELTVRDASDGIAGISVPGAVTRDVAKGGIDDAIQNIELYGNPSIAAQTATAGIETAKTLFSRKIRAVKANLKAGHKVLLKKAGSNY